MYVTRRHLSFAMNEGGKLAVYSRCVCRTIPFKMHKMAASQPTHQLL